MKENKKVIVTGGAGFIGSSLVERLLSDGWEVLSIDNFNDFYDPAIKRRNIQEIKAHPAAAAFKSIEADIRDSGEMLKIFSGFRPLAVIHLAAMAGVRPSIQNPGLYWDVNVIGTQAILNACIESGTSRMLFASSSSVYGNNPQVPFSESDNVDFPISPYAATKKTGELMCHTYAHLYKMNIACLRFFTVYGPRQRPDLAIHKFSRLMQEGKEIPFFGDGSTQRDYTFIDDIIDGVVRALDWTKAGRDSGLYGIFNLGESRTISLSQMIQTLENALKVKARIKKMPMQPGDVDRTYADVSKAKRVLGYSPSTEFEDGIARFIAWLRKEEVVRS